jgi:uncharacterized caspase-like protein
MKIFYHQIECKKVAPYTKIEYPLYSKLNYILIGVGNYKNLDNLRAPSNDIPEMKKILERMGFTKNEDNILLNERATKSKVWSLLERIKKEMEGKNEEEKHFNSNSMLIFYFSGHGMDDKQKDLYQICTHDYDNKIQNGIDLEELSQFFFEINCKHVLLILDCCYGGAIFKF